MSADVKYTCDHCGAEVRYRATGILPSYWREVVIECLWRPLHFCGDCIAAWRTPDNARRAKKVKK